MCIRDRDKGTLLIDLASRPGGVDFNAAAELQIKTIWALSLPGRVAPKSAGQIIKTTILNMIRDCLLYTSIVGRTAVDLFNRRKKRFLCRRGIHPVSYTHLISSPTPSP